MSYPIPERAMQMAKAELSLAGFRVLAAFCHTATKKGVSSIRLDELERMTGICEKVVKGSVAELVKLGLIERERTITGAKTYLLHDLE